jgi:hypothetical protein
VTQAWQPHLRIQTAADLNNAIITTEQVGAIGLAYLLRAVRDGRCACFPLLPDTSNNELKRFIHGASRRPAIALIGDDDGMDRGPAGWRLAKRAIDWARSVVVHASGAELDHYAGAVVAAHLVRRVLIIECSSATAPRWAEMVQAARPPPSVLVIQPPPGASHPIPVPRLLLQ